MKAIQKKRQTIWFSYVLALVVLFIISIVTSFILADRNSLSDKTAAATAIPTGFNKPCAGTDFYIHFWPEREDKQYQNPSFVIGRTFKIGQSNSSTPTYNPFGKFGNGNIIGDTSMEIALDPVQERIPQKFSGHITDFLGNYGDIAVRFEFSTDPNNTKWSPDSIIEDYANNNADPGDWSTTKLKISNATGAANEALRNVEGSMKVFVRCNNEPKQTRTMVVKWKGTKETTTPSPTPSVSTSIQTI